jgi:hypothetical protein
MQVFDGSWKTGLKRNKADGGRKEPGNRFVGILQGNSCDDNTRNAGACIKAKDD